MWFSQRGSEGENERFQLPESNWRRKLRGRRRPRAEGEPGFRAPHVPRVPYGYLHRQGLSTKFAVALQRYQVVLAVAPNGYGKTALLAHELSATRRPLAWVEIEERMAVPSALLGAFCAALAQASPELAGLEGPIRAAAGREGGKRASDVVAEALAQRCPDACIVLDGYENIESEAADAFVDHLMERLPQTARLVIASSSRPNIAVNRMALRGRLYELKTSDFEFGFLDAVDLFNDALGLEVSRRDAERINAQMDGWVAGLRMVEVALRSGMGLDAALRSGAEPQRDISRYLADDIVDRQPADVRAFLLRTAVFESFCADLCDSALQADGSADAIADLVERRLFVQQGDQPGWYRYARFFRACLLDLAEKDVPEEELKAERVRASRWLASHGMTEEALEHAIEAGDYAQVSDVLSSSFGQTMGQSGSARMDELIAQLPENIVSKSRWANVSGAIACEMRQCFEREGVYVKAVLADGAGAGPDDDGSARPEAGDGHAGAGAPSDAGSSGATLAASLNILRMLHDYHLGKAQDAIDLGRQLLRDGSGGSDGHDDLGQHGRCGVLNVMGISHWYLGELDDACDCWQQSANLAIYVDWAYSICLNLFGIAHARYLCGRFDSARETCRQVFSVSDQKAEPVLSSGYAHLLMAKICYDCNELDEAQSHARTARHIAYAGKEQVLAMNAEMGLARIELAQGDREAALSRANRCLSEFTSNLSYRQSFAEASLLMAQVWLIAGNPDMARGHLTRFAGFDAAAPFSEERAREVLAAGVFGQDFRSVLSEGPLFDYLYWLVLDGRTEGVCAWLDRVCEEAQTRGMGLLSMKALILEALCLQREGDEDGAVAHVAQALALGEACGCTRVFAEAGRPMAQLLDLAKRKHLGGRFADEVLAVLEGARPAAGPAAAGSAPSGSPAEGSADPASAIAAPAAPEPAFAGAASTAAASAAPASASPAVAAAVPADARTAFGDAFTPREREIMGLLCEGATNDEISKRLYLSLSTVKNHIHHVYTKLGVRNRAEAVVAIRELGR